MRPSPWILIVCQCGFREIRFCVNLTLRNQICINADSTESESLSTMTDRNRNQIPCQCRLPGIRCCVSDCSTKSFSVSMPTTPWNQILCLFWPHKIRSCFNAYSMESYSTLMPTRRNQILCQCPHHRIRSCVNAGSTESDSMTMPLIQILCQCLLLRIRSRVNTDSRIRFCVNAHSTEPDSVTLLPQPFSISELQPTGQNLIPCYDSLPASIFIWLPQRIQSRVQNYIIYGMSREVKWIKIIRKSHDSVLLLAIYHGSKQRLTWWIS
jgi:hypothetical protein